MRAALITTFIIAATALAACGKQDEAHEQNIVMDNGVMANADIEALPPDESSATPSNQLINGADDPNVVTADNQTDSY
jgi:hypothetical protein